MKSGYFYSESTGLYVSRGPLKVDARVIKAATECGIKLNWDDEGRINYINLFDACALLHALGATMLTMKEYWLVFRDAQLACDEDMLFQLQSNEYAEWLNTVFEKKEFVLDNPAIKDGKLEGERRPVKMPFGHPGWLNPEDIDFETGLPKKVELNREKFSVTWKYWSFCDYNYVAAAVRSWVTSVGKPSLDLGIPADAVYPVLLLRECRKELPQPPIDKVVLSKTERFVRLYDELASEWRYEELYSRRRNFLEFVMKHGKDFYRSKEAVIYRHREKIIEILGLLSIVNRTKEFETLLPGIDYIAAGLSGVKGEIDFSDFKSFIMSSRRRLETAMEIVKPISFVVGHKNPDTDTVIGSIAEAYRNQLIDGGNTEYIPVVQGVRVPDEVKVLIGEELSEKILLSAKPLYEKARNSGQARWIMVDHNRNSDIQKFALAIIDHHVPSDIALKQNLAKTLEMVGSTTALVVQKIMGLGISIPEPLARILYGATLMDTENRAEQKMTPKDKLIMNQLKLWAGIESDDDFYQHLMSAMLNTDDADLLFARDYKEDWDFFGFAVVKVMNVFSREGNVMKPALLERLVNIAIRNNFEKNLYLTIIKVVDYERDNRTVNRERIYLIFNQDAFAESRRVLFDLIAAIVRRTFKGKALIKRGENFFEFWGVGDQLSRKRTAPLLEPVVSAFNQYFYSQRTKLFVKRNFLKATARVKEAARLLDIKHSTDTQARVNYITYGEAIRLLKSLGYTALSQKEFWQVLEDAWASKDQQMVAHLQSRFVEFLHAVIEGGSFVVEKPEILETSSTFNYEGLDVKINYSYKGDPKQMEVLEGKPGLVLPEEIDKNTGFPAKVHSPNIYNNPKFWRYWSPDAEKNVATRGYIFLLGQPALDIKVHLSEAFACLGIRPCCEKIELPKIKIQEGEALTVFIENEGETTVVKESEFFSRTAD